MKANPSVAAPVTRAQKRRGIAPKAAVTDADPFFKARGFWVVRPPAYGRIAAILAPRGLSLEQIQIVEELRHCHPDLVASPRLAELWDVGWVWLTDGYAGDLATLGECPPRPRAQFLAFA